MRFYTALAVMMVGCCALATQAQTGSTPTKATGAIVSPAKSFDAGLSAFEKEMMGVAEAMPAEKYDFRPTSDFFKGGATTDFNGVNNFSGMVKHVAQANYFFASTLSGLKPDRDVKAIHDLSTKDDIVAALSASFAFAHKAVATLTSENAFESIDKDDTRVSLAGGLVAHGFDHYGQLVEYLRMNGIVPPASRK